MHAVFYKNIIQLRHDPAKPLVIGLTVIGSAAIIALIAGTDLTARLASPLYRCAFAIIGVGLAPLTVDTFRDDAAESVIAAARASGQADGRTILTIPHDLDYCRQEADRVVVLDDKRIVRDCMVAGFADEDAFRNAVTLGRERDHVDFGLHANPAEGKDAQ